MAINDIPDASGKARASEVARVSKLLTKFYTQMKPLEMLTR